jgi:hypothetical protein
VARRAALVAASPVPQPKPSINQEVRFAMVHGFIIFIVVVVLLTWSVCVAHVGRLAAVLGRRGRCAAARRRAAIHRHLRRSDDAVCTQLFGNYIRRAVGMCRVYLVFCVFRAV